MSSRPLFSLSQTAAPDLIHTELPLDDCRAETHTLNQRERYEQEKCILGLCGWRRGGRPSEVTGSLICTTSRLARPSFLGIVKYHGYRCVLSAPVLTALSQGGRFLRDGFPAAPGRASPHVEFVLGGGVEVRQTPAGLGRGGDVDVI